MLPGMNRIRAMLATIAILVPAGAMAAAPSPLGPNKGVFGDWTAATYGTGTARICYAFTRPQHVRPAVSSRGPAMLTVTERHGSRDEISITPGFTYAKKSAVSMVVGKASIPFYVQDNTAFTDSVTEALAGFARESTTSVTSTGPKGVKVTDKFSLTGFSAAYKAINKACP
jgi:hypothetical protein